MLLSDESVLIQMRSESLVTRLRKLVCVAYILAINQLQLRTYSQLITHSSRRVYYYVITRLLCVTWYKPVYIASGFHAVYADVMSTRTYGCEPHEFLDLREPPRKYWARASVKHVLRSSPVDAQHLATVADMAAVLLASPFSSVQIHRASSPLHTLSYLSLHMLSAHCCLSSPIIWQQVDMAAFLAAIACCRVALCSALRRANLCSNILANLSPFDSDCSELQM